MIFEDGGVVFGLYGLVLGVVVFGLLMPRRSGVAGSLCFACVMAILAALAVLLDAHFIAIAELLSYGAAAIVLFLCALMPIERSGPGRPAFVRPGAARVVIGIVAIGVIAALARVLLPVFVETSFALRPASAESGGMRSLSVVLLGEYSLLVAGVGLLLLATVVSAASFAGEREE